VDGRLSLDPANCHDGGHACDHPSLDPADTAAVVEFSLRAWAPVFDSFLTVLGERVYQALYPDWAATQARAVEAVCQDDTAAVWVAEQDARPVGYVAVRIHKDGTGEIDMLAVDPRVQRQGIGTALTVFAMQRLREAGVRLAVVGTGGDPGHASARRVYEKAGFVGLPLSGTTRGSTQRSRHRAGRRRLLGSWRS
jgi:ribosomal protein S18 acetylase RimI-like enzyme